MKKKLFLVFFLLVNAGFASVTHAASTCPKFDISHITSDSVIEKIDQCVEARKNHNEQSITEFSCPSGEFAWEDGRPLSHQRLAYLITTNILMNEVDKQAKKYMKTLQENRNKDTVAWTEDIRKCIQDSTKNTSLRDIYSRICEFSFVQNFLNENNQDRIVIDQITTYPQTICTDLANRKIQAWVGLANNLMHAGIEKSFQNDSDEFLSRVQGSYKRVLDKFHIYQRIVARAASKITHYIRNAVK